MAFLYTDHPLYQHELELLQQRRGLQVIWLPGRRRAHDSWLGSGVGRARDVDALHHWVPDLAQRDVYICGPEAWTSLVKQTALALGTPEAQIHVENFRW